MSIELASEQKPQSQQVAGEQKEQTERDLLIDKTA